MREVFSMSSVLVCFDRVLKAPGGGSSNIFGHYQEESDREEQMRRQRETQAVMQSNDTV